MSKFASRENLQYLWKKSKNYTDEKISSVPSGAGYRNGSTIVIDNLEQGEYIVKAVYSDGTTEKLTEFVHNSPVTQLKPGIPEDCTYIEIFSRSGEQCGRIRAMAAVISHPDFAQTDENAPTFIRNKTHWSDYSEVLPETTISYNAEMEVYMLTELGTVRRNAECTVVFNGTEYSGPVYVENDGDFDIYILGNYSLMTETGDTGEPFVMIIYPEEFALAVGFRAVVIVIDGSTDDITLAITSGKVHKLDNMFLNLDWIPATEEKILSDENTVTATGTFIPYADDSNAWEIIKKSSSVYVYWDGQKYRCTLTGNALDGIGVGFVGETFPFRISFISNKFYVQYDDEGEHTVRISCQYTNKMPDSFMPESIGSITLRSSTADSTKLFRLTVDDNGAVTATEITQ